MPTRSTVTSLRSLILVRGVLDASAKSIGVSAAAILAVTGCGQPEIVDNTPVPTIDVGDAAKQDTPVPTGNADDIDLPQIEVVDAPPVVLPGQVVSVRLGSDFSPADSVVGVAVVIDGVPGWFKAVTVPEPAAVSDGVDWIFPLSVVIADTAADGENVKLEFALLLEGDVAGGFETWEPSIDGNRIVECPQDIDCSTVACGPDPLCGFECGTCSDGLTCNGDGQCEAIGGACPDIADCGDRQCGADPICGTVCGSCNPGELCSIDGQCEPGAMTCGDGSISGAELCDGAEVGVETCETQGFDGGTLICNAGCDGFDTSGCTYTCGDAGIDPGETCDGTDVGTETCVSQGFDGGTLICNGTCDAFDTSGCTYTCGDGNVDPGETCDDAGVVPGDGCDDMCQEEMGFDCVGDPSLCTPICGDGNIVGTETCDGANVGADTCATQGFDTGALACNGTCNGFDITQCVYVCGDGNLDPGEACDDMDFFGGDGCDASCAVEPGWTCDAAEPSVCTQDCGNGVIDVGEDCDGANLGLETCVTQLFDGGTLLCGPSCTFDTAACFVCGDGVQNGTEACDGSDVGTSTCAAAGYDGGVAICNGTCDAVDYTGCTYQCGDGGVDPGEVCDGGDLNLGDCMTEGFDTGTLACAGDCLSYDTTMCAYDCGDGIARGTEVCDGLDTGVEDCISQGFDSGTLSCAGDCLSLDTTGCILAGEVAPLYPLAGAGWNDWVQATGSTALDGVDAPCDSTTGQDCTGFVNGTPGRGDLTCHHAGVLRQLVLPYADCTGVVINDAIGAFDWICDDSTGTTRAVSTGLATGMHLSDLLDWNASPVDWLDNSLSYTDGITPGNSLPSNWWPTTPVQEHDTGGVLPVTEGVFAVTTSVALSYEFSAPKQSLVSGPGVMISGIGINTDVIGTLASSSASFPFTWVEASVDALLDDRGMRFGYSPFLTVDNSTILNATATIALSIDGNSHGFRIWDTAVTNTREGIAITGSDCSDYRDIVIDASPSGQYSNFYMDGNSYTNMARIESHGAGQWGINMRSSAGIVLDDARLSNNGSGGISTSGTKVRGKKIVSTDNGGPGLTGGGGENHWEDVISISNNGHGIGCTACRVQGFFSANNSQDGVNGVEIATHGTSASNQDEGFQDVEITVATTAVLNGTHGHINSNSPNLNIATLNNGNFGYQSDAGAYVSDMVALFNNSDSSTSPWDIYESQPGVRYSGMLLVTDANNTSTGSGSNASCESNSADPPNAGHGIDDDCTAINASDFTLISGPGTPTFLGPQAVTDSVNADGATGTALYETITDFSDFENEHRGWGENGLPFPDMDIPGACRTTGETCAIYDWTLAAGDTVLQDAVGVGYMVDPTTDAVSYTWGTWVNTLAKCDALGGVYDSPIAGLCSETFLRRAMEISGDGIGDDNGLCESDEDCLRLRHIGGYQGSGNLVVVQNIGTGGTVENVTLYEYDAW